MTPMTELASLSTNAVGFDQGFRAAETRSAVAAEFESYFGTIRTFLAEVS